MFKINIADIPMYVIPINEFSYALSAGKKHSYTTACIKTAIKVRFFYRAITFWACS